MARFQIPALTLVLLLAVLTGTSQQRATAQVKEEGPVLPLEEDRAAYEIYSILLLSEMHPSWQVTAWLIEEKTTRGPLGMCLNPREDQESTYRPVIEDFERRNEGKLLLKREFDLPAYTLVNAANKPQNAVLTFEVSAVGFNKDHTRALVYVAHHCGSLCGGGMYHLMAKKNGKWEPDRNYGGPSCAWAS